MHVTQQTTHYRPLLRAHALMLLCAIILLVGTMPAVGAPVLNDRLNQIKKEIKTTTKLQNVKEKQAALIKRQIQNINTEATTLEQKITQTKDDLDRINRSIGEIRENITKQTQALTGQKKVLAQLIRTQYEAGTETPAARLILPRAHNFSTNDYIAQTQNRIHTTITHMSALRAKMEQEHAALEAKKSDAKNLEEKLQKRNDYLESTRNYKAYLVSRTNQEIHKYQKKISQLEQEEITIRREIERIELAKLDSANFANLPSRKKANFTWPVKNHIVTQGYGRTSFAKSSKSAYGFHNGVDFAGDHVIRAAADGTVKAVGYMRVNGHVYGYGRWVAIDHGNGLVTLYGHMNSVKVKKGKKLHQGDAIGIMGSTGYAFGVHLHFSVFTAASFDVVDSRHVKGLKVPVGASVNPFIYL